MVSIKDVAQAAGVSVSTVSHVINETRFVAPDTKASVQEAVRSLGYQPSSLARALKSNRSKTLGMLVTSSTNPFFAEVVRGVEEGCYRSGFSLILCNSGEEGDRQTSYLDTLRQKRVDALVVMTVNRAPSFQEALSGLDSLPKVVLDSKPFPNACAIGDDSVLGGRLAAEHLIRRGHREIGCLTGPKDHPRSRERYRGFALALQDAGLSLRPEWVAAGELTAAGGYEACCRLLDSGAAPRALFAFNDLMAMGAYRAILERGLSIPGDISVIGYDDLEFAPYLFPALTTVRQPSFDLGLQAAELLIRNLETKAEIPPLLQLTPELICRDSVS